MSPLVTRLAMARWPALAVRVQVGGGPDSAAVPRAVEILPFRAFIPGLSGDAGAQAEAAATHRGCG